MEISKEVKREAFYRGGLAVNTGYKWSLAVIQLGHVSDSGQFMKLLKEHVKKYDGHVPADIVMKGELVNELYIFMMDDYEKCAVTLGSLFGGAGFGTSIPKNLSIDAGVGVAQFKPGMSLADLVKEARELRIDYQIGELPEYTIERIPEPRKIVKDALSKVG